MDVRSLASSRWIGRLPLIAAALLTVGINVINIERHYRAPGPSDPWEAAETVEAYRSVRGTPVYDAGPNAHATHMYGALAPWTLGEVFRFTGVNNQSGRLVTLIASLATVLLLAAVLSGDRTHWYVAVAGALFFGLNHRSGNYFVVNRPDMPALLLASLAVILMGIGHESRRWALVIAGTACMVTGFFFKQTAAIVGAVPLVALMLRGRRPTRAEVVFALFPAVLMMAVVHGLRLAHPAMYRAMILMPRGAALNPAGTVRVAWELLLDFPLVLLLIGEWIARDRTPLREQRRLLWVVATFAIVYPFSALSTAKGGGANNSLLGALLCMAGFVVLRLPRLNAFWNDGEIAPPRRFGFGAFLGVLFLMSVFPHLTRRDPLLRRREPRSDSYWAVVEHVRALPGRVLSPEDPTIALFAKRLVGRNLYSEYDCNLVDREWPSSPPPGALAELKSADYIVDVRGWWQDILDERTVAPLGFEPVADPAFDDTHYRLWQKKSAGRVGVRTGAADAGFEEAARVR